MVMGVLAGWDEGKAVADNIFVILLPLLLLLLLLLFLPPSLSLFLSLSPSQYSCLLFPAFLTNTLYVPAAKPLNVGDEDQFVPPSMEYS